MSGVMGGMCWGRVLGVHVGDEHITAAEMASTIGGGRVLNRFKVEVGEAGHGAALKALLEENYTPRQRRRMSVCLGIAAEQTFFATRPLNQQQSGAPSLDALLVASGAASVWEPDQTVADYVKVDKLKGTGGTVYSVAASRRALAEALFSALTEAGVQSFRLEPSPWSVLRAADRQGHPSRRWKTAVRVLLQEGGGLAILVSQGQPLLWRRFSIPATGAASRIAASGVRAVLIHAAVSLRIRQVDGVAVQGKGADKVAAQIGSALALKAVAIRGEGFTDELRSHALALSAKYPEPGRFDLFRSLRSAPRIRSIFPWKLAAFVVLMAGCMALTMWDTCTGLASQADHFRRATASPAHTWAHGQTTAQIKNERKRLAANVGAVRRFLRTRVVWSNYLRDLPTRLPSNACLSNVRGVCELKDMSKKKQKRKTSKLLTLRGITRFEDRDAAPEEIDAFLAGLRNAELLQRDFPRVQLAEIKWRREGNSEMALFTIVALPKKKQAGAAE